MRSFAGCVTLLTGIDLVWSVIGVVTGACLSALPASRVGLITGVHSKARAKSATATKAQKGNLGEGKA